MKKVIAVLLIILGLCLGIYLGIWVMFIGGIAGLINVVKTQNFEAMVIAINIAKILFASLVGYISAFVMVVPAFVMLESEKMK